MFPEYPDHHTYTRVAKDRSELWRTILGVCVMVGLYLALALVYQIALSELLRTRPGFQEELVTGATPFAMFILLFSFGLISVAVFIGVRLIHKRAPLGVLGPLSRVGPQFIKVFSALIVLNIVLFVLPPYGMGGALVPNLEVGRWLILLPLSLVAVFVQISAEEIFFRGYLQQQFAARFKTPLIWMGVPSFFFAIGHYQPAEAGENAVLITVWAGIFGLLMADLTARAGSIGPALAVHFVNNLSALLIIALPDSLGGLALLHTPFGMSDAGQLRAWLPVDFAVMITSWLAARLALRR